MGTIPGYNNGVTYDYSDDFVTFGLGLLDSVYSADGSIQDSETDFDTMGSSTSLALETIFTF